MKKKERNFTERGSITVMASIAIQIKWCIIAKVLKIKIKLRNIEDFQ